MSASNICLRDNAKRLLAHAICKSDASTCKGPCHRASLLQKLFSAHMQANSTAFSATYSSTQLQNMTYDNSGGSDAHTYTYASEFSQARPTDWSHALGVDAYSGGNVTAGVPQLLTRNDSDAPQGSVCL